MEARCRLADLFELHPRLLWDTAILATQAALLDRFHDRPPRIDLDIRNCSWIWIRRDGSINRQRRD